MAAAAAEQQPTTCESWNDVRLCLVENYGNGLFDAMPITFKGVTFTWTRSAINYRIGGGPVSLLCTKSAMVLEEIGRLEAQMRDMDGGKRKVLTDSRKPTAPEAYEVGSRISAPLDPLIKAIASAKPGKRSGSYIYCVHP